MMGKLHDKLKDVVDTMGHPLELFLVRLLFLGILPKIHLFLKKEHFLNFWKIKPREDGSDLGSKLTELFQVLNTPFEKRLKYVMTRAWQLFLM